MFAARRFTVPRKKHMTTIREALESVPDGSEFQLKSLCDSIAKMTGTKSQSVSKTLQEHTEGYGIYKGLTTRFYKKVGTGRVRRVRTTDVVAASEPWQTPALSEEASGSQRDWDEAQRLGELGEKLVNRHFEREKAASKIQDFRWRSKVDPFAPADFWRALNNGSDEWAEVKATGAGFEQTFFVSLAELELAVKGKPYRIYRAYEIGDQGGKVRVSTNFEAAAREIVDAIAAAPLPPGVTVSSVRIDPKRAGIDFGSEIRLAPLETEQGGSR
jgi:hypothetical protein